MITEAVSGITFLAGYVCGLATAAWLGLTLAIAADIYRRRAERKGAK